MKNKNILKTICVAAALVLSGIPSVQEISPAQEISSAELPVSSPSENISAAPLSDKYINYMKNNASGIVPSPVDYSSISYYPNQSPLHLKNTAAYEFPESYDLRTLGLTSSVKNQGNYGTCWAHAVMACAESLLIRNNPLIDLSEWHLAYFTYFGDDAYQANNDPFADGGSSSYAIGTLAQWKGFVSEDEVPAESGNPDPSLAYSSLYHLTDAEFVAPLIEGDVTYDNDYIKSLLMEEKCVLTSYYDASRFMNKNTDSYYCNDSSYYSNHSVTVVGWDDNYSKENFNASCRPKNDGAWLIKNSWGYDSNDNGYFWLSYEDATIAECMAVSLAPSDNYSNIYSYDSFGWTVSLADGSEQTNSAYMANIFEAKEYEDVCAASFYSTDNYAEYEIYVYTDLDEENISPVSGTGYKVASGTLGLAGYHTVDFEHFVPVSEGDRYSVVVSLKNPSTPYPIAAEAAVGYYYAGNYYDFNMTRERIANNTGYGQSFVSADGVSWTDTNGLVIPYTDHTGFTYESTVGNVCLKAFTNPARSVQFSQNGGALAEGDIIYLSGNPDSTIYYTTDGSAPNTMSQRYSDGIVFSGDEMNITARLVTYGGVNGRIYSKTFHKASAQLSSLILKENGYIFTEVNTSPYDYTFVNLSGSDSSFSFIPTSTGTITINGVEVTSGVETQLFTASENDTFEIIVSEEGKNSTIYNIRVDDLDYTVLDNGFLVYDENKYSCDLPSYTDVTEYAGSEITLTDTSTGEAVYVAVPEKAAALDETALSVDYLSKSINGFENFDVENVYFRNELSDNTAPLQKLSDKLIQTENGLSMPAEHNKNYAFYYHPDNTFLSEPIYFKLPICCDVSNDGQVSALDIVLSKKYLIDGEDLDDIQLFALNSVDDGKISVSDFIKMKAILLDKQ